MPFVDTKFPEARYRGSGYAMTVTYIRSNEQFQTISAQVGYQISVYCTVISIEKQSIAELIN
jgi:hypothetical protein